MPTPVNFSSSPNFSTTSYSYDWASRYAPADDGNCSENVAVKVLTDNGIPIRGQIPFRGNLCGVDINNMPCLDAIAFSLAENLIDGKFIECYMDADGFAYFVDIYPNAETVDLDIRSCVPTTSIDNKVDLVIVRGYDTPPVRYFKDFESLKWLDVDSLSLHSDVEEICQGRFFITEAWKSYKDPVLESSYKDGVESLYDVKEFESLAGYVIDFDGSTRVGVKYSMSPTTTVFRDVYVPGSVGTTPVTIQGCSNTPLVVASTGLGSFTEVDRYGEDWPLFNNVQAIYISGYKITNVEDFSAFGGLSDNGPVYIWTDGKKQLINLPTSNWHWERDGSGNITVKLYYQVPENNHIADALFNSGGTKYLMRPPDSNNPVPTVSLIMGAAGDLYPYLGGGMGMAVSKCFAAIELDRPCVMVTDPEGFAYSLAYELEIKYQPIVVEDKPAPVAYTFGGGASLVDHTLDLYDTDPSTLQDPPDSVEGSMAWLQSHTSGNTVDVSFPFLDEGGCMAVAGTLYSIQKEEMTQYSLVCGPKSQPKLGAKVNGFDGRINRISESFQDGSSYNINVSIGPTFPQAKGFQQSLWTRKTDDVSREGIVLSSSGDGVNYVVRVRGLGVFQAVNKTANAYVAGDKVSVTVYNVLQEY